MALEILRVNEMGFCFGVRRAISILEKEARERGKVDTLGVLVHNEQVVSQLNDQGINVINSPEEITSSVVAISAHGVSPQVEAELHKKKVTVIDTTCPDVKRAQGVARKLAGDGYWVVVFGEARHSEVKGILGWAGGKGLATLDLSPLREMDKMPRKLGILSQTTQVPENFGRFVKELIDLALVEGAELRIINTICHGVKRRQTETLELAKKADLMLVVGSNTSANSRRLLEICSAVTEAHMVLDASEVDPNWLQGKKKVGVTSGTSSSAQSIDAVIQRLEALAGAVQSQN